MKAISLRQPWADLVMQGKKTLELRSWTVSYRGPLAIHASQTVSEAACQAFGIRPDQVTSGAILGTVELVSILELDEREYQARKNEHLAGDFFKPDPEHSTLYGWQVTNPQPLPQPAPFPGRMGLFNVPDELFTGQAGATEAEGKPLDWDARYTFELRVVPERGRAAQAAAPYRLSLYQRLVEPPPAQRSLTPQAPVHMRPVAELGGDLLKAVADQVLDALRQNRYAATDLSAGRREPFVLSEESGVRLGLLFLAVRPITKMGRVEAISLGIRAMTSEELYYWFSKCTSGPAAARAQTALRILLSGE